MSGKANWRPARVALEVLDYYVTHGESVDVKTLAKLLDWSEGTVRRALDEADGVASENEWRESISQNYQGLITGTHKVRVYHPTRAALREAYLRLSDHCDRVEEGKA